VKERKDSLQLEEIIKKLVNKLEKTKADQKENKKVRKELDDLRQAFEKSEKVRKEQKNLIEALRKKVAK